MLVAVAVAILALGPEPAAQAPSPVEKVFASYCEQAAAGEARPYCGGPVPENVQWLVLYSLCSTTARDPKFNAVCEEFTKDVVAGDAAERKFLTYDPRPDKWTGASFRKLSGTACESGTPDVLKWYCRSGESDWLDISEAGLPTVTRAASDDIPVLIVGVNPLLYGTTPVTVTSEDIEALASLQQIALGLGGVLQSGIGLLAKGKVDSDRFSMMSRDDPAFVLPDFDKPEPPELTRVLEARDKALETMVDASRDLAERAGALDIARSQALVSIQEAEQGMARAGTNLTITIENADSAAGAYANLRTAYTALDTAYRSVRDFGLSCRPLLRDFLFIIKHAPDPPQVLRPYLSAFIKDRGAKPQCGSGDFGALEKKVLADARGLAKVTDDAAFQTLIGDLNTRYNAGLKIVVEAPPKADDKTPAPLDAALDILTAKRNAGLATHHALVTAGMRRQDYCFAGTLMMTWLYVEPKTDQLPWSKVQTHAFSLMRNAPLASGVTGTLAEDTALQYKLQSSKATGLGVGLGVIYTKLSEPQFGPVTDPANKEQKLVSQTDTETLAGQLALFADWRLLSLVDRNTEKWFLRPSLQVGTNVSTTPGFFVGLGADFFKYFRVGIGRTWQQSKRLSPSQTLDKTVVASADEIKTEDFFAKGRYFSFSFALDSLPLFKKSDSGGGSEEKPKEKEGGDAAAAGAEKKKAKAGGEE